MPIERMRIPDEGIPDWIKTLRDLGFSNKEIDTMLANANRKYARGLGIDIVEEELARTEKYLREKHGRILTQEQRRYLRESIKTRPEFKDHI